MESSLGLGSEKATGPGGSSSSQGTGFSPASALFPPPLPLPLPPSTAAGTMGQGEAEFLIRVPRHLSRAATVLTLPSSSPWGCILIILWDAAQAEAAGEVGAARLLSQAEQHALVGNWWVTEGVPSRAQCTQVCEAALCVPGASPLLLQCPRATPVSLPHI